MPTTVVPPVLGNLPRTALQMPGKKSFSNAFELPERELSNLGS
jgi:hypothetical protein